MSRTEALRSQRPRCGDHVFHDKTGETWVVAWVEDSRLSWSGWPEGSVPVDQCEVIRQCSDEEHRLEVKGWSKVKNDSRAARVLRLYGDALAAKEEG